MAEQGMNHNIENESGRREIDIPVFVNDRYWIARYEEYLEKNNLSKEDISLNQFIGQQVNHRQERRVARIPSYDSGELEDRLIDNRASKNKGEIPKNRSVSVKIPKQAVIAMIMATATLAGVAVTHLKASKYIANKVSDTLGFENEVSVINFSASKRVYYADHFGNPQNVYADCFVSLFSDKLQSFGVSADEFAIFCDYYDICSSSEIEGSSLLGRVGQELIATSEMANISVEHKTGKGI